MHCFPWPEPEPSPSPCLPMSGCHDHALPGAARVRGRVVPGISGSRRAAPPRWRLAAPYPQGIPGETQWQQVLKCRRFLQDHARNSPLPPSPPSGHREDDVHASRRRE